jgi:hypothetical protein
MYKPTKAPVRLTIGYGLWSDDWSDDLTHRFHKTREEYIDISDVGSGRMSKRMAQNFVVFLKNAIATGSISVEPKKHGGGRVGIKTQEMFEGITAFRSNLAGEKKHRGWLVSIKEKTSSSREYPLWYRLSWLEYGTINQPVRPIVAKAFSEYVAQDWVKKVVEDMVFRGVGMTALKRVAYARGGD